MAKATKTTAAKSTKAAKTTKKTANSGFMKPMTQAQS